jgi:uncharacterized protein YndB with AHSA1/START domain
LLYTPPIEYYSSMNKEAIKKGTGKAPDEWFGWIEKAGLKDRPHKEIADYVYDKGGVSYWWAQEITVEFEKHIGRRIVGQTEDGLFQIGVSKTIAAPAPEVWEWLQSAEALALITDSAESGAGALETLDCSGGKVIAKTTTFKAGSHVRLRWRKNDWPSYSILQIRVTPKGDGKTVLAFHQEKLPSESARARMREYWQNVAEQAAGLSG